MFSSTVICAQVFKGERLRVLCYQLGSARHYEELAREVLRNGSVLAGPLPHTVRGAIDIDRLHARASLQFPKDLMLSHVENSPTSRRSQGASTSFAHMPEELMNGPGASRYRVCPFVSVHCCASHRFL